MMTLLSVTLVLTLLAALMLFLVGKETAVSGLRLTGQKSLYIAEGGAAQARAALMAYVGAYPTGFTTVDPSLLPATVRGWYNNGVAQNPLALLNYLVVDGQRLISPVPLTTSSPAATFQINWGLSTAHLKLQYGGAPANTLGDGTYTATVTLAPKVTPDPSCTGRPCAVHLVAGTASSYEIFYTYTITSIGSLPPSWRREVKYTGNFSVYLQAQSFARYALFTDTHTDANGNPVWFANPTTFSGPVYTNGEFRFYQFPTFTSTVQSASPKAWYYNNGNNVELAAVENVRNGTRVDAALAPPAPTPQAAAPANFTLGAPTVPFPSDAYNQQGVAIGLPPGNYAQVTPAQIDAAIPELKGTGTVPNGIYVPVTDAAGDCVSDPNINQMLGGVYVQGDLDSLTMSVGGPMNSQAVYTLTQGKVTATVTVDRALNQTTVTMIDDKGNNAWPQPSNQNGCPGLPQGPMTRRFTSVPKGWQGPGNDNGAILYVQGQINSLSGTLQQNEQTTVAASGTITIQGNVQYQTPPNPSDPTSNPLNILGLFSSGGDIVIGQYAPDNVIIQAVLMAGTSGSAYKSVVTVKNYSAGQPRGTANLLGGIIEKYYGAFGQLNSQGGVQSGYGRNFTYDTRMSRGFAPPFYPGTSNFQIAQGSGHIAGVKPIWSEVAPP